MSNFFDKLKQGVSDAGKKAHQTVESTTLKFQVSSKEKDIEKSFTEIGRLVHVSMSIPGTPLPEEEIQKHRKNILDIEKEIEDLQRKIQNLQNLKECGCGKMLPADATYCPFCGQQFQKVVVQPVADASSFQKTAHCSQCGHAVSPIDRFCGDCGHALNG
ncbi:zinc ribbon domain-containing protein [Paenibacillus pini]|uniref:DZANK-type domain-containing protein n=1 Tax=Paenibacillus pini JCM 16418 TaxID=1236976 RepID=W7YZ12_9BACL|nr:zinc ribbon domain-containing protein [Paenibacillus pini]GAF07614.1 hypothetical protein JCM16418_1641 [Paenibacillus pini JCM 16418]